MIGIGMLGQGGGIGGVPLSSLYLGQVATKARIPSASSTTNKQFNSRSHHIARDNITSLKVVLPNWWWDRGATLLEKNLGGTITYTCAIEYPSGTFTQVKFSGSASVVAANNSSVLSDFVNVTIPSGSAFWVRVFATSATGIVFGAGTVTPSAPQCDSGNGEAMNYAASGLTDLTMGGTITPTTTGNGAPYFSPSAIVAMTRQPSVFLKGDSRVWGLGDAFDSSGDLGELARSIGAVYGYINAGCSGDTIALYLTSKANRLSLVQYCSHVLDETGINDLRAAGGNRTSAAVLTDLQTAYADYTGKRILRTTIPPASTSSDNFATLANQVLDTNQAQIAAFNNSIRAGLANVLRYFEVADVVESSRNSGKWIVNGTANAYTIDGLHESPTAYALVKSSGAINTAQITR